MTSSQQPTPQNLFGTFFKRNTGKAKAIVILTVLISMSFQQGLKAETYQLLETHETYVKIRMSGMNLGWWPFNFTDLVFHFNLNTEYHQDFKYRVWTTGTVDYTIYYLGRAGTNSVHSTPWVAGITPYGPNFRFNFTAPMLGAPRAQSASIDKVDKITLRWRGGTSYAGTQIEYEIREGGTYIATIQGTDNNEGQFEYTVTGLGYNVSHTYTVTTKLKETDRVSQPTTISGNTFGFDLSATDDEVGRVVLRWDKPADLTTDYKISRNGIDLDQVGSSIASYIDDQGLTPGLYMNYSIEAIDDVSQKGYAIGRSRPNGKISGSVTTPYGDPIGGVTIKIERTNLPGDTVQKVFYATTAHDDGSYFNETIYYGADGAEFIVTPQFANHMFDPDTLTKTLSASYPEQSAVNFKDTTALSVKGTIMYKGCPAEGISIVVNGIDRGYITNANGSYTAIVSQPGNHTITPKRDGHHFDPESYEQIPILDNITGIDFEDTTLYMVNGYFSASCNTYIGTAQLRFFTNGACIDTTITTTDTGYYEVKLPPREYNIEVLSFSSADEGVVASGDVEDYFVPAMAIDLETEAQYDSTKQIRVATHDFTYRLQPALNVSILGRSETCGSEQIILEQNREYQVVLTVNEIFNGSSCHAESGYIVIEQDITGDNLEVDTISFSGGAIDTILVKIGVPNIIEPYLKSFKATAYVGIYSDMVEYDVLVVGHKPRNSTFTTVSPSLPFLILHDPPGDGSSSYMEESTSLNFGLGISMATTLENRIYGSVKVGIKLIKGQFVLSETESGLTTERGFSIDMGINTESKLETSVTTTRHFSTSGNADITGDDGDVYFGGALNLIYALTDIVEYNYETCEAEKTVSLAMEPDGFATTFMYTESHITDVLTPQLEAIRDLYKTAGNDSALVYDKQISEWSQVVENNHKNISEAEFVENISISGGSEVSSSIESSVSFTQTITTSLSLGTDFKIAFGLEESGTGFEVGYENSFKFEMGSSASSGVTTKHTTGYTLADDDIGDYMSVDILRDKVYGTPAFYLKAATTSCPWEAGSQPREGVQLRADSYTVTVDDPAGEAVFRLQLANTSESDEDNTYELIFDPTSNPNGAYITIGGSPVVGNVPTPYNIPAGGSVQATVTVKKGPYSSVFRNLKFTLRSTCDGSIEDAVLLNAIFETDCGGITLTADNMVNTITQNSGNSVPVNISGYTMDKLNSINIRVSTLSQDWTTLQILAGSDIGETGTDVDVSFENQTDGIYYLEAVAMCTSDAIESEIIEVTVDRTAPVVLFKKPYDGGVMHFGDDISASFNEPIKPLNIDDISIINNGTGSAIDFEFGCAETRIVLLPSVSGLNDGDQLEVTISNVTDIYGNVANPFSWSFTIPSVEEALEDPMLDSDKDGIPNSIDICMLTYNPNQEDMDEDGIGDSCDDDIDGDGVFNTIDKCPLVANADQADTDNDGLGDACDTDTDGDAVFNVDDNCSSTANPDQNDMDFDGLGDSCDADMDGDGVDNNVDNCARTANQDQTDSNNNGIGDACDAVGTGPALVDLAAFSVYPNPFNSELRYELQLEESGRVKIELCNFMGQSLKLALDDGFGAGYYSGFIKTTDLPSGIYFIRVNIDDNVYNEKIIKME